MKIICDWENCKETGAYKAPIEKDNSKKYRLLCLNHIKIFNKSWNYFENMNDQDAQKGTTVRWFEIDENTHGSVLTYPSKEAEA